MTAVEYNEIVDEMSDKIYRYALKTVYDADTAQDIVQDAFEKLWVNRDKIPVEKAGPFLYRISYNYMIDRFRKDKRQYFTDTLPETSHSEQYTDLKEVLEKALATLSEQKRSVLLLRDYEGYSYKEIGDIMEMTEPQVKITIFRARAAIKEYIGTMNLVLE